MPWATKSLWLDGQPPPASRKIVKAKFSPADRASVWESVRDGAASGWRSGFLATVIGIHLHAIGSAVAPETVPRMVLFDIVAGFAATVLLAVLRRLLADGGARRETLKATRDVFRLLLVLGAVVGAIALLAVFLQSK